MLLATPKYAYNCEQISTDPDKAALVQKYDQQKLFRGAWEALRYLHAKGYAHCDIRAKNIAVQIENGNIRKHNFIVNIKLHRNISGDWHTILTGLKYCRKINKADEYPDREVDFRLPMTIRSASPTIADKYQLTCVMYCFLHQQFIPSPDTVLVPFWPCEPMGDYKDVHMKHFCKVMFKSTMEEAETPSFPIKDTFGHPYFMTEAEMVAFTDRLCSFEFRNRRLASYIDDHKWKSHVFGDEGWMDRLEPELQELLRNARTPMDVMSAVSLWLTQRNSRHHRDEDTLAIQILLGILPVENFNYWQDKFPYFFIFLYFALSAYKYQEFPVVKRLYSKPEFRYFFPSTSQFYRACCKTELSESEDNWP